MRSGFAPGGPEPVNGVEHLLGYVRGQLAGEGMLAAVESHGIAPVVVRLAVLGIHLRRREPSPARTVEVAGEVLADLARLLAAEAELGAGEIVEQFREAVSPTETQGRRLDLPAARADLSGAIDHTLDLGRAVLDLAAGEMVTARPLIDSAVGAAGRVLAAASKAAVSPSDPSDHPSGQLPPAAAVQS